MALPIPIIVAVGVGIGVLGGGAAAAYWKWDEIRAFLQGREFGVLGARQVGKTTLLQFLRTGKIDSSYRPTLAPEEVEVSHQVLGRQGNHGKKPITITVKEGIDVSGNKAAYASWQRVAKSADILLYLFRADLILQKDDELVERMKADASQMRKWLKKRGDDRPLVYLIGTHCDLDDDFDKVEDEEAVEYYLDTFGDNPAIKDAARKTKADAVILGSLIDEARARGLVFQLFQHIETAS